MDKAHVLWALQWVLYCFLHSFLAHAYVKEFALKVLHIGAAAYRVAYNVIAFLHLAFLIFLHLHLQSHSVFAGNLFTASIAVVMMLTGALVMGICISKYFRQLSGAFETSAPSTLYTGGLHRLVRHPLYFGTFVFLIGAFLYWPLLKNGIAVTIIIAYTLIGIKLEETKLLKEFGDAYRTYRQNVPMIIPRLRLLSKNKSGNKF